MTIDEILTGIRDRATEEFAQKLFVPGKTPIPVSGASLNPDDIEALGETVLQYWYTEYRQCARFEKALRRYTDKNYATLVNSGSSANLVALSALRDVNQNPNRKNVITTALGFPTTLAPIYQCGYIPIFVDVRPDTLTPNYEQVDSAYDRYGADIAGAFLPHTLGFPYNENLMSGLAASNESFLLVDACDALGAKTNGLPVGAVADAATYSFFPAHIVTAIEGGAILTDRAILHRVINSYSNWGRDCKCLPGQSNVCGRRFDKLWDSLPEGWDHKYTFSRMGYNFKMTEFQGALGYSQMGRLDEFIAKRRENYRYLRNELCVYDDCLQFVVPEEGSDPVPFGFPVMVRRECDFTRKDLVLFLEKNKIATRPMFGGNLTRQPAFKDQVYIRMGCLEDTDYVMENGFWIGCHPGLTEEMLAYVVKKFKEFFGE